jgi:putative flippase GtrA
VLNALIWATGIGHRGASFAIFKTISFLCAVLNSYLLNRNWTFESTGEKRRIAEGSQFLLVSCIGAAINVGTSWYVATFVHPPAQLNPRYWPSVAALCGTACALAFNFFGYKYLVFAPARKRAAE